MSCILLLSATVQTNTGQREDALAVPSARFVGLVHPIFGAGFNDRSWIDGRVASSGVACPSVSRIWSLGGRVEGCWPVRGHLSCDTDSSINQATRASIDHLTGYNERKRELMAVCDQAGGTSTDRKAAQNVG